MNNEKQLKDERLEELRLIQEHLLSFPDGKLYVWGAAKKAQMITSYITQKSSLCVSAYVVNDLYVTEAEFLNKPVLKASEFFKAVTEKDWLIFSNMPDDIVKEAQRNIPPTVKSSYFSIPLNTETDEIWLDLVFYRQYKKRFDDTRDSLSDDISKQTMDAFIKACITGNTEDLNRLFAKGQYFNELVSSCKPGCFIDCGAYTGDTIESAFEFLGDRIERIIAFEPNPNNMVKLKELVEKTGLQADKLKLLQKGSYDKTTVLRFSSSADSSTGTAVSENGDVTIETDSIDNAAADMGEVSFIKMDVEGSELKSIWGAAETIRKYHPVLAICAYHKPENLFELPEAIREITNNSGYRFYLRHYGPGLTELVLYAVPIN